MVNYDKFQEKSKNFKVEYINKFDEIKYKIQKK